MEKFVFYSGQNRKQNRTAYFVNLGKVLENIPSFFMIKMTYTVIFYYLTVIVLYLKYYSSKMTSFVLFF